MRLLQNCRGNGRASPYAKGMGRKLVWREGEECLISITPVAQGLFRRC